MTSITIIACIFIILFTATATRSLVNKIRIRRYNRRHKKDFENCRKRQEELKEKEFY